jgi:hypothetical protein
MDHGNRVDLKHFATVAGLLKVHYSGDHSFYEVYLICNVFMRGAVLPSSGRSNTTKRISFDA